MSNIKVADIKKLRDETGAPIARAKEVLEETGDLKKATEILKKEGHAKMAKRTDRETSQGRIASYVHHSGKVGAVVTLLCETDFVAKNELFINLASDLAMQIASMNPANNEELLAQDFIKDTSKKISELVNDLSAKTGENIRIASFGRSEI